MSSRPIDWLARADGSVAVALADGHLSGALPVGTADLPLSVN